MVCKLLEQERKVCAVLCACMHARVCVWVCACKYACVYVCACIHVYVMDTKQSTHAITMHTTTQY